MTERLDPPGCRCTDCLTDYSLPLDEASELDMLDAYLGKIVNATGYTFKLNNIMQIEVED